MALKGSGGIHVSWRDGEKRFDGKGCRARKAGEQPPAKCYE